MSASMGSEVKAEPNLTPLLDVVFQLITFFMLVINFSAENYDQRVNLPIAGSASPVEANASERDRLVLNITKQGELLFNGEVLNTEAALKEIGFQAELVRTNARLTKGKEIKRNEDLPTTIVIRSDRETPFTQVYSLITACQTNGFRKFSLKAMTGQ